MRTGHKGLLHEIFLGLILCLLVLALSACGTAGGGGANGGGLSGVRVNVAAPGGISGGTGGLAAGLEGVSDVATVTVDVLEGAHYLVNGQALTGSGGTWSVTINSLPMNANLVFVAHAYDGKGSQVFSGSAPCDITSANNDGNPVEILLSPVAVITDFPVISGMVLPASVTPSEHMSISVSVSGISSESLTYIISDTSGGTFTSGTSGNITLNGSGSSSLNLAYTAPSADGAWTDTITVTNSQGNSVSQGFVITVSGTAPTDTVSTIAGKANVISPYTDGIGNAATFYLPHGIATDGTILYVADLGNDTIRKIVISTGAVTTIAGQAGVEGYADGTGTAATFYGPAGITMGGTNLYVTDDYTIRKIVIATGQVTTIAGQAGVTGSADGTGTAATFHFPFDITTDGTNLYVSDTRDETIRMITGENSIQPPPLKVEGF